MSARRGHVDVNLSEPFDIKTLGWDCPTMRDCEGSIGFKVESTTPAAESGVLTGADPLRLSSTTSFS